MSELRELYQQLILDHNRRPQNFRIMPEADAQVEGYNPLCGDQMKVFVKFDRDVIEDVSFIGSGCAISKASGSMMTLAVKGKTRAEAEAIFQRFRDMVTGQPHAALPPGLGKLAVFAGVCEFPSRVKCASLSWHALRAALTGEKHGVTTEAEGPDDVHVT